MIYQSRNFVVNLEEELKKPTYVKFGEKDFLSWLENEGEKTALLIGVCSDKFKEILEFARKGEYRERNNPDMNLFLKFFGLKLYIWHYSKMF